MGFVIKKTTTTPKETSTHDALTDLYPHTEMMFCETVSKMLLCRATGFVGRRRKLQAQQLCAMVF
jgi:hypothetical protein